jgi:hypothetical protein
MTLGDAVALLNAHEFNVEWARSTDDPLLAAIDPERAGTALAIGDLTVEGPTREDLLEFKATSYILVARRIA